MKAFDRSIAVCDRANSTKLWSLSSTSASVTDVAESMITREWQAWSNYSCYMSSHRTWQVQRATKDNDLCSSEDEDSGKAPQDLGKQDPLLSNLNGVIPVFNRAYKVHADKDNVLKCSCKNREGMGFPCRHVACVLCTEPNFAQLHPEGFPLSAISVMWHTAYYLYGISSEPEHQHIHETYKELRKQDTTGVRVPLHVRIPEPGTISSGTKGNVFDLPAVERVQNYDTSHVRKCFQNVVSTAENLGFSSVVPTGMTQQSNVGLSQNSYSDDDDFFTLGDGPSYTNQVMQDIEDNHALDDQDVFIRCKSYYRDTSNVINGLDHERKEKMV